MRLHSYFILIYAVVLHLEDIPVLLHPNEEFRYPDKIPRKWVGRVGVKKEVEQSGDSRVWCLWDCFISITIILNNCFQSLNLRHGGVFKPNDRHCFSL